MSKTPKHSKVLAKISTATILQENNTVKSKDPKFKMNPHLANGDSETPKSESISQDTRFTTTPNMLA